MTFSELGLSAKVLAAVEATGYTSPTPIQEQAIPVALSGRDVLGIAQTGTGKTAGFVLPMLTRLETGRARARMPRSLIIAPTRELAAQVAENFEKYGVNHKLTVALLIGGVSFDEQNRKLDRGADVLIATPGRLLDHFQRGKLLLTGVEILVIDEADRMLDMGFIPDIERICSALPIKRQTLFFSATMPPEIQRLVATFLKDPARIEATPPSSTAGTITQRFQYVSSDPREKRDALRKLIRSQEKLNNAIVFCNRKRDVAVLFKSLRKHGFNAGELHGDLTQFERTATLDGFRSGEISLLAASDVAARGLDIPDVSHVFNFDVPVHAEDYVHRIGRTGRAGREGFSATLVTGYDMKMLGEINKMLKQDLVWLGDPPPADAGSKRERSGRGPAALRERDRNRDGRPARGRDAGSGERPAPQGPTTQDPKTQVPKAQIPKAQIQADATPVDERPLEDAAPRSETGARKRRPRRRRSSDTMGARPDTATAEGRAEATSAKAAVASADGQAGDKAAPVARTEGANAPERDASSGDGARQDRRPRRGRSEGGRGEAGRRAKPESGQQPQRDDGARASRDERPEQRVRGLKAATEKASEGDRQRSRRSHQDDGPKVVGLGDHIPDFLKRSVRSGS